MTSRPCLTARLILAPGRKFRILSTAGGTTSMIEPPTLRSFVIVHGISLLSSSSVLLIPNFLVFLRKFFIEIKFFSASPRCNWFSPVFLRVSVPPWWVLLFGCGLAALCLRGGFWLGLCYAVVGVGLVASFVVINSFPLLMLTRIFAVLLLLVAIP